MIVSSPKNMMRLVSFVFWFALLSRTCNSYRHAYSTGEELYVKVNSLTSLITVLPFSYYSLPYCCPIEGIKKSAANLDELLMGDLTYNSPYRFRMNVNETIFLCITDPLTKHKANILKRRSRDLYQVNMILDNLPVLRYDKIDDVKIQWTGFPVGYYENYDDYIINHLRFTVLIHEFEESYEIVGFEVVPCSVAQDSEAISKLTMYEHFSTNLGKSQPVREQERVTFSYEVEFVKSDIKWPSRWDAYLEMKNSGVHWFSILNSVVLAGTVFLIFLRILRRDLTQYAELDKQDKTKELSSGWKVVVGDVFREPNHSKLLCVMVGDGVQIMGMDIVTIILSALGLISSPYRGKLLTSIITIYLFLGIFAGYAGVRLWSIIKGSSDGWLSVAWWVSCFFPGIVLIILTTLNFLLCKAKSTAALPISLFFILISVWFSISVPLTFLGGFLGTRAEATQYPVKTNYIPREIPPKKYPSWMHVLGAGTLPFVTLFIELYFILFTLWFGRFYNSFDFLFIVICLLVIVCAEVSVMLTYTHLCLEDWEWWWKAFFASGSVSLFVFLYSIYYLVFDLQSLSGPVSALIYLGYSLIMAIAIMLATGTIGFLVSFYFVYYLCWSLKID